MQCFEGFGLKDGVCEACEDKFCKHCDEDRATCSECITGFHIKEKNNELQGSVKICLPCLHGCKSCETSDQCYECRNFFQAVTKGEGSSLTITECKLKYWILILFLVPMLVCLGISFAYEDNWVENILKKNKPD